MRKDTVNTDSKTLLSACLRGRPPILLARQRRVLPYKSVTPEKPSEDPLFGYLHISTTLHTIHTMVGKPWNPPVPVEDGEQQIRVLPMAI